MGKHAKYMPSSAHRWLKCPGCVALAETVPEPEPGQAAIEGTAAHWIAEQRLKAFIGGDDTIQGLNAVLEPGRFILFEKRVDENGGIEYWPAATTPVEPTEGPIVEITDEMNDAVKIYTDYVISNVNGGGDFYGDGGDLHVETRVDITDDCFGTADVIIDIPFDTLHVIDYKNGVKLVKVFENPQLELYGAGALQKFGDMYKQIVLTVVQPNANRPDDEPPIHSWRLTPDELLERAIKFDEARFRCENEPTTYIDGEHCQWCAGIRVCPTMLEKTQEIAKADFESVPIADITAEDLDKLKTILDAEPRINELVKAAKKHAIDLIQSGVEIPGYRVEPSLGNRRWRTTPDGDPDVPGLVNFLKRNRVKIDEYKPRQLISPAKMEKLINDKKRVAAFTERPDRGFRLAKNKDNTPALSSAKSDFDPIEVEKEDQDA